MARTKTFDESKVLEKAVYLFWEQGYNATSANDLVSVLGLSRSSLYGTYGDKRTLFLRTLKVYNEKFTEELIKILNSPGDVSKAIKQVFELVIDQDIESKIPKGCFMVNSAVELSRDDKEVASLIKENREAVENAFKNLIKRGQKKAEVSKEFKAKHLAKFFFNNISGMRVSLKYDQDKAVLDQVVKVCLSTLKK